MSRAGRRFLESLSSIPRLAHHPDCTCYDAHVLRFGGLVLCLGCTCMAAGAIATACLIASAWLAGLRVPDGWALSVAGIATGLVLYAPTLAQPFRQHKAFKIAARSMLGAAVVVLLGAGLMPPPLDAAGLAFRGCFIAVFWLVFRATLRYRAIYTPDPCGRCSPAVYPFCEGNRRRVAALLDELKRTAGPEDAEFVAFACALAGEASAATVEVTSLRAIAGPAPRTCHRS